MSELQSAPEGRGQHWRGISRVSHFVWARWFLCPLVLGNLSKRCLSFSRVLGDCIKLIAERWKGAVGHYYPHPEEPPPKYSPAFGPA